MQESYPKQLVRERHGREPADILRELYVDQRRTQGEIASFLGISRVTVSAWLRDYGISRDDRKPVSL